MMASATLRFQLLSYKLSGFGADFVNSFTGTTALGANSSLLKAPGESCVVNNAATQYCSPTDNRSYAGNWLSGLLADGITPSNSANLSATVTRYQPGNQRQEGTDHCGRVGHQAGCRLNFNYTPWYRYPPRSGCSAARSASWALPVAVPLPSDRLSLQTTPVTKPPPGGFVLFRLRCYRRDIQDHPAG